jgi:hypothetical protein
MLSRDKAIYSNVHARSTAVYRNSSARRRPIAIGEALLRERF